MKLILEITFFQGSSDIEKINKFTLLREEATSVLAGILSWLDGNQKKWLLWMEEKHGAQRKTLGARGEPTTKSIQIWLRAAIEIEPVQWEVSTLAMIEPPLLPRASACTFGPSVCWVAYRLCLGVCLLCIRLSKHLSQFHSDVIDCEGLIRLLFKLLAKFRNALKQAPLLVVKISRKTSPQRWRFSFAFKQKDKNYPPRKHSRNERVIFAE